MMTPRETWLEPEFFYRWKAIGRILLLVGIACYGVGLLLKRARAEREHPGPARSG